MPFGQRADICKAAFERMGEKEKIMNKAEINTMIKFGVPTLM